MLSNYFILENITLCTLGSPKYFKQNQKALNASCKGMGWGAVKNIIVDNANTIDEWNRAVVFDLGDYIDTDFAMFIHPDGYIVHPESWWRGFIEYDYIGAPWPVSTDNISYRPTILEEHHKMYRVGNSVSLRSRKLLQLPKKLNMEWRSYHGFYNEDGYICVNNRHIFEEHGCKFAPLEVAKYFSREREIPENQNVDKPFAFHHRDGRNSIYKDLEEAV